MARKRKPGRPKGSTNKAKTPKKQTELAHLRKQVEAMRELLHLD